MTNNKKPGAKPGNTNAQRGAAPATSQLQVRCTPADKAAWVHAAARRGLTLSAWAIAMLNKNSI